MHWLWWWSLAWAADGAAPSDPAVLLAGYEAVRVPLVTDGIDAARQAAGDLAATEGGPVGVTAAARAVAEATDPSAVRMAFGELSKALVLELAARGAPAGAKVYHCPMTPAYGYWLQTSSGIANPYMGVSMPTCGEGTSFKAAARAAGVEP